MKLLELKNLRELILDYSILDIIDNEVIKMLIGVIPKLIKLTKLVINTYNIYIIELLKVINNVNLKELRITAPLTNCFYCEFYNKLVNCELTNLEYVELKNTLQTIETNSITQLWKLLQYKAIEYDLYYK